MLMWVMTLECAKGLRGLGRSKASLHLGKIMKGWAEVGKPVSMIAIREIRLNQTSVTS